MVCGARCGWIGPHCGRPGDYGGQWFGRRRFELAKGRFEGDRRSALRNRAPKGSMLGAGGGRDGSCRGLGLLHSGRFGEQPAFALRASAGSLRCCAATAGRAGSRKFEGWPASRSCAPAKAGGDGEIRTLDASFCPHAPLAGECLRPLGHVSGILSPVTFGTFAVPGRQRQRR